LTCINKEYYVINKKVSGEVIFSSSKSEVQVLRAVQSRPHNISEEII